MEGRIRRWPPWQKPPRGTLLNKAHPLARGLDFCHIFNELTGNHTNDYANSSGNGTISGPEWVADYIYFDGGQTDKISCGTTFSPVMPCTFATKFYITDFVDWRALWSKRASTAVGVVDILFMDSGYGGWFYIGNDGGGGAGSIQWGWAPTLNTWYDLVVVFKSATYKDLYINGLFVENSTANLPFNTDVNEVVCIGNNYDSDDPFKGGIEYSMWWDRILTPAEISWLHREPYGMFL